MRAPPARLVVTSAALILAAIATHLIHERVAAERVSDAPGARFIGPRAASRVVEIERDFDVPFEPERALLRTISDPAAEVALNGAPMVRAGYADTWRSLVEVDATPWVRSGMNSIRVTLLSPRGRGATLVWLEAKGGNDRLFTIGSDATWISGGEPCLVQHGRLFRPFRQVRAPIRTAALADLALPAALDASPVPGAPGLFDLGEEMVGFPVLADAPAGARLVLGESRAEAEAQGVLQEDGSDEMDQDGIGFRRRAFRYARVDPPAPGARVGIHPVVARTSARGAFRCSDADLQHAYDISARTLRNCVQGMLEDGPKRDRQAWSGDLLAAAPAAAYLLGRSPEVAASFRLLAAHRCPDGGITANYGGARTICLVDYQSAYLAALDGYLALSGDADLQRELLPVVREQRRLLVARLSRGLVSVDRGDPITDWMSHRTRTGAVTYQQGMALLGLQAASRILGEPDPALPERRRVMATSLEHARLPSGLYADSLGHLDIVTHDASVLAVLGGLAEGHAPEVLAAMKEKLWTPVGPRAYLVPTDALGAPARGALVAPFMAALEAWARFEAKDAENACEILRRTWRPMTESGCAYEYLDLEGRPLSWEGRRPHVTSLCHAWSAGPAWLLPAYVLGVRPVERGFRQYVVAPQGEDLAWARGEVPMGDRILSVSWEHSAGTVKVEIDAPSGLDGVLDPRGLIPDASTASCNGVPLSIADGTFPIPAGHSAFTLR